MNGLAIGAVSSNASSSLIVPTDQYRTPDEWVNRVREVFGGQIDLDPFSNPANDLAEVNWQLERDGDSFEKSWHDAWYEILHGDVVLTVKNAFCNPPYSQPNLPKAAAKILEEAQNGLEIIALVPCDPSTTWWRDMFRGCTRLAYSKRIKFVGAKDAAKFASCFFYFGPRAQRFSQVFSAANCLVTAPCW